MSSAFSPLGPVESRNNNRFILNYFLNFFYYHRNLSKIFKIEDMEDLATYNAVLSLIQEKIFPDFQRLYERINYLKSQKKLTAQEEKEKKFFLIFSEKILKKFCRQILP